MTDVTNLLERPVYGMGQIDRLLGLSSGTARRWIDGYERSGKEYAPLVRVERTGDEIVTWGEFVETRLLSEYRESGALTRRMRPAIEKLREEFDTLYPLAHAKPFVAGRELVLQIQEDVGLDRELQIVVVRNDQIVLTERARSFYDAADFEGDEDDEVVRRIRPMPGVADVVIDPLRQFGEPVVRSVPTAVIAEQVRAGDTIDGIAELYDLERRLVESAVRYELLRQPTDQAAA